MCAASGQGDPSSDPAERTERARLSLEGLSVGDAFGEATMFAAATLFHRAREMPRAPWPYTDDTMMAISIVEQLESLGRIDPDDLAQRFAERFLAEPDRGYGSGAARLLYRVCRGADWREAAARMFHGTGSMGNGSAMRVAPLGAYFADDLDAAVEQAGRSAVVTHMHREGVAGAVAVAVAAAVACRSRRKRGPKAGRRLLAAAAKYTPRGATRDGIVRAAELPLDTPTDRAASKLGNGCEITCPDTVPFCLWCAAAHLGDFDGALGATAAVLGDCDTNCAIVGGIVALTVGRKGIGQDWLAAREPLPGKRKA